MMTKQQTLITMNILITGGTGLIGQAFIKQFQDKYNFTVLTRQKGASPVGKQVHYIDSLQQLTNLNDFYAVINLQGEPIFGKRWSLAQKQTIKQSRLFATQTLSSLFNQSDKPPKVFLSGSAIGYYGRQSELAITEDFNSPYPEFSHQLCQKWESAATKANSKTRVCLLRTGIVLSPKGGALAQMAPPFYFGLGAVIASGQQYMSWIHLDDMVLAIDFLLNEEKLNGVVNMTAPQPVTNHEFSKTLASVLHRPCFLTMPAFMVNLLFGDVAELVIYGQHVIPQKLTDSGFHFQYPQVEQALKNLMS